LAEQGFTRQAQALLAGAADLARPLNPLLQQACRCCPPVHFGGNSPAAERSAP